jgi:glutamine synthetase
MSPNGVIELVKEKGAKIADLRFLFLEGIGFDGASIRSFQTIDQSDRLLLPDAAAVQMDPFTAVPTMVQICNVKDPVTGQHYGRDRRDVAQNAEAHVKGLGIADAIYIDSDAGFWTSGRKGFPERPDLGYRARYKQGYSPVPPADQFNSHLWARKEGRRAGRSA